MRRPIVRAHIESADGLLEADDFLLDSGADRTVFNAHLLKRLNLADEEVSRNTVLQGVGGVGESVLVRTVVILRRDDGGDVSMRGEFAAFTDPTATDLSILGRDVLNHFDLILSRRHDEVLLLASNHQYRVEQV